MSGKPMKKKRLVRGTDFSWWGVKWLRHRVGKKELLRVDLRFQTKAEATAYIRDHGIDLLKGTMAPYRMGVVEVL